MPAEPTNPEGGRAGPEPLRELTLGRRTPPAPEAPSPAHAEGPANELAALADRCRRKADAARRAAARARPAGPGPDDPELAAWAEALLNAYFWRETPDGSTPDPALLDRVGGGFMVVAAAAELLADEEGGRGPSGPALALMAEAQSALRRALRDLRAPDDPDQLAAFEWTREVAARRRVFLKRHMRADDAADPAGWPDLLARIASRSRGDDRRPPPPIARVLPCLEALREGRGTDDDGRAVVEAVDEAVRSGVPPSDRGLRDLLLPVLDALPDRDDPPPGLRLVLREVDRYLATRPAAPEPSGPQAGPTAEVAEARELLAGRSLALIGGTCRPAAREALRSAFGLADLAWIETKEHQSIDDFEPTVARPDVAAVLLAIRWSSHAFGDVKRFCDRHGKPLVRLPGGYNPNQVAAQILAQCGDRLRRG